MSVQELLGKIQKFIRANHEHDIEYIEGLFKLILHFFVIDFKRAMSSEMDVLIWNTMRETIEPVRSSKSKGFENVLNMCISFLSDLCLLVQAEYGITLENVPDVLYLSSAISHKTHDPSINIETINSFCNFICLRLGDLFRYKKDFNLAEQCYKKAIRADPFNGAAWNQMGLIAQARILYLDKVYYNCRATDIAKPFFSSTTNTVALLKMYTDDSVDDASFSFQYLTLLSEFHFLRSVNQDLFLSVSKSLREFHHIIPLFSLLKSLGNSEDEERIKSEIRKLLRCAYSNITKLVISDESFLPWSLCLLLRIPEICFYNLELNEYLSREPEKQLTDSYYLEQFKCFEDPLTYPVTHAKISAILQNYISSKNLSSDPPPRRRTQRTLLCAPKDISVDLEQ